MQAIAAPTTSDLRAFLRGTLAVGARPAIDAWLSHAPAPEVERALAQADVDGEAGALRPVAGEPTASGDGFRPTTQHGRLTPGTLLGMGGMAEVVLAEDAVLARTVALKRLRVRAPGEALDAYHLRAAAFRNEAAITAGLEHPAIVPIYDVGEIDGHPAFTMKRIEGRRLDRWLVDDAPALVGRIELFLRVAEAVAFAHHRGIVHRDLTPANVLAGGFGTVYVLDWGVAERVGAVQGVCSGTPGWMPPEQAAGAPVDPRQDVYALGGLLGFLLTGVIPDAAADAGNPAAWARKPVPRPLAAVIRRCRERDPALRYPDATAVAAELRRWLDHGLTDAERAGFLRRLWRHSRRSRQLRWTALGAVLALGLAFGGWQWARARWERTALERVAVIAREVPLDKLSGVAIALDEVRAIGRAHPGQPAITALEARLAAAVELHKQLRSATRALEALQRLQRRARCLGPQADPAEAWIAAVRDAGYALDAKRQAEASARDQAGVLDATQAAALTFLSTRAQATGQHPEEAAEVARMLQQSGPTAAWQALGRAVAATGMPPDGLRLPAGGDGDAILGDPAVAGLFLALGASDPRLDAYAARRAATDPDDFWAAITAAGSAATAGEVADMVRWARQAHRIEPASILPVRVLAAAALRSRAWPTAEAEADDGLALVSGDPVLLLMRAAAIAALGRVAEAQGVVAALPPEALTRLRGGRIPLLIRPVLADLAAVGIHLPPAP